MAEFWFTSSVPVQILFSISDFMKKILALFLFLFISTISFGQAYTYGQARGAFLAVEVGPRIPMGDAADKSIAGPGFNGTFLYTNNLVFPLFVYGSLGYMHFPGNQELYKRTDYSSYSTNLITMSMGFRYFFPPFFKDIMLLMPVLDVGANYGYFERAHRFKESSGTRSFTEDSSYGGFHVGGGFSMFIVDVLAYYNYFHNNQFVSLNLRVTIPIYVIF